MAQQMLDWESQMFLLAAKIASAFHFLVELELDVHVKWASVSKDLPRWGTHKGIHFSLFNHSNIPTLIGLVGGYHGELVAEGNSEGINVCCHEVGVEAW